MKRQFVVRFCRMPVWLVVCVIFGIVLLSQSSRGAVIESWVQRTKNPAIDIGAGHAVAFDAQGDVVIAGVSIDINSPGSGSNYYTAKYSGTAGALLWEKSYSAHQGPPGPDDHAVDMVIDGSNNVIVTGSSPLNWPDYDFYTVKYAASNGSVLWDRRYNGLGNGNDRARALAVDSTGNVFVAGFSGNTNGNADFYTAKYAAGDGSILWEKRYNAPSNSRDEVYALAVDAFGNVAVTGVSVGEQGNQDYYTIKYSGVDGATLWEKRYNGPGNGNDQPNAIAVDVSGNVVVTGISENAGFNMDIYTAKYAADDGGLIWEKRYNGPANSTDSGSAIAVDGVGNVLLTGGSGGDNNNSDYYTAKYAGADGRLLWEVRYAGATNGTHFPVAVVLDGGGNPVVTGYSWSGVSSYDYYTAKYSSLSGSLVWEARYDGPVHYQDSPIGKRSIAIGPNGQVAVTGSSAYHSFYYGWATILYKEVLPPLSVELLGSDAHLQSDGIPGTKYYVERASNIGGPWEMIASPVASDDGLLEYIDRNVPPGSAFYRTRTP